MNKAFIKMMDKLGYDVELTNKKKAAEKCYRNAERNAHGYYTNLL